MTASNDPVSRQVNLLSPGKINLMLRVIGRRGDGYHLLQSCFQRLPWGDDMQFNLAVNTKGGDAQDSVTISGFKNIPTQQNLIYQAAQKLRPHAQRLNPVTIKVNKVIPQGSGLGGGSSNAATTLKVLNELWHCQLTEQELQQIGLELGADVPFFINGQSALVTGIGEHITPMNFFKGYVLLMFPEVTVSTATVFNSPLLNRRQSTLADNCLKCSDFWINDCLPVVLKAYPDVAQLFRVLSKNMLVRMSGTGSTLFALFDSEKEAVFFQKIANRHCRHALIKI